MEAVVESRFESLDGPRQAFLRDLLRSWFRDRGVLRTDPPSIRNKMARLFAVVFVREFPLGWPSFFQDISSTITISSSGADMFLRVMLSIHEEVVDREVDRASAIHVRNTALKDNMRLSAMDTICDAWANIIGIYNASDPHVVGTCMQVISFYTSWIDISLVANERFLGPVFQFLMSSNSDLREGACDCITGLVNKGMLPAGKIQLIQSLQVLERVSIVKSSLPPSGEEDFLLKLALLVNGVGMALLGAINRC
jgi:exportin-T